MLTWHPLRAHQPISKMVSIINMLAENPLRCEHLMR